MSYRTTHGRLWRARGKAAQYPCARCGDPAHHWAYDHTDPHEITQLWHGKPVVYSRDVNRYRPMCRSCHNRLDFSGYEGSGLQRANLRRGSGGSRWKGKGSTTAWRKIRSQVLVRDGYRCQLRLPGICTGEADQVHHSQGPWAGDDPQYLVAVCRTCNLKVPRDPTPKPLTRW